MAIGVSHQPPFSLRIMLAGFFLYFPDNEKNRSFQQQTKRARVGETAER
jgi:hypothetical protein